MNGDILGIRYVTYQWPEGGRTGEKLQILSHNGWHDVPTVKIQVDDNGKPIEETDDVQDRG